MKINRKDGLYLTNNFEIIEINFTSKFNFIRSKKLKKWHGMKSNYINNKIVLNLILKNAVYLGEL